MKNAIRFLILCLLAITVVFYSCQKEVTGSKNFITDIDKPHPVTIYLTDHQTPVFDSVFIDLRRLEVKLENDTLSGDGWIPCLPRVHCRLQELKKSNWYWVFKTLL